MTLSLKQQEFLHTVEFFLFSNIEKRVRPAWQKKVTIRLLHLSKIQSTDSAKFSYTLKLVGQLDVVGIVGWSCKVVMAS